MRGFRTLLMLEVVNRVVPTGHEKRLSIVREISVVTFQEIV